jgi:hypothetical protein
LKSASREQKPPKDSSHDKHDKEVIENGKQVESYRESLCTATRRLFEKGSLNVSHGPFLKSNCLSNVTVQAEEVRNCYNLNSQDDCHVQVEGGDHPLFVTVENNFVINDDTSICMSLLSEDKNHDVVFKSLDPPYYENVRRKSDVKQYQNRSFYNQHSQYVRAAGDQRNTMTKTSESNPGSKTHPVIKKSLLDKGREYNAFKDQKGVSVPVESTNFKPKNAPYQINSVDSVGSKKKEADAKQNDDKLGHEIQSENSTNKSAPIDPENTSLSISERRAIFQKNSIPINPRKKWARSSIENGRQSRKSSLSLQDVVKTRQEMEDRRKSSISLTDEHTKFLDDTPPNPDANVRPSELLKKMKTNKIPPEPPSPLLYRRGFSSITSPSRGIKRQSFHF